MQVKLMLRQKYQLPVNSYLIGSFQRDTEGVGCDSDDPKPKLEKGADLLADFIIHKHKMNLAEIEINAGICLSPLLNKIHVVLAGWRRQYIMKRLDEANVPYTYFENPPITNVRELYQTLDLYPVTARYEGGPQSLIECGLLNVPVVSRPIGVAAQVLPYSAIHEDVSQATPIIPLVEHLMLPEGYRKYRELFERITTNG